MKKNRNKILKLLSIFSVLVFVAQLPSSVIVAYEDKEHGPAREWVDKASKAFNADKFGQQRADNPAKQGSVDAAGALAVAQDQFAHLAFARISSYALMMRCTSG